MSPSNFAAHSIAYLGLFGADYGICGEQESVDLVAQLSGDTEEGWFCHVRRFVGLNPVNESDVESGL